MQFLFTVLKLLELLFVSKERHLLFWINTGRYGFPYFLNPILFILSKFFNIFAHRRLFLHWVFLEMITTKYLKCLFFESVLPNYLQIITSFVFFMLKSIFGILGCSSETSSCFQEERTWSRSLGFGTGMRFRFDLFAYFLAPFYN